jgi:hypothetical protein
MKRLLILSCSDTKREPEPGRTMQALQLYDGPAYRVVRGYLDRVKMLGASNLSVLILSAEHGLIGGWDHIQPYDRKMDVARASELAKSKACRRAFAQAVEVPADTFAFAGASYRNCISELAAHYRKDNKMTTACLASMTFAEGRGIGDMLAQLKAWLEAGTLTEDERADALALELDAIERRYDGPIPAEARDRMYTLNAELRLIIRNRPASN